MNALKLTRRALGMLCLALVLCSGCKKEKQRHYDLLPPDPEDVTAQGVLSTNIENTGGPSATEGSIRVTDGFESTKFLIFSYDPSFFIQLKFKAAQHITSYTLTSANDAPERDPKNWTLAGSNDEKVWKDLDTRTNESFSARGLTKNYEFTNPDTYTYYRLNITANGGSTLFQLAEWRVTNVPLQ
ncbi:discoidin domain-containing protein [Mucilaginibacter sp. CAU 1740]|uniref:discoidin domain-containing protein n=1 Tax=Mucilaginibacter sp. CAU 1740 TaxID=3140365 RepID=UPI00325BEB00